MAERSQATKDSDVAVQDVGVEIKAANGGSTLSPFDAPDLVPANDPNGAIANGSPRDVPPAVVSKITVPPPAEASKRAAAAEATPQSADGSPSQVADGLAAPGTDRPKISVSDIRRNSLDSRGEKIDFVFFMIRDCFAIYWCNGRIMVQYADKDEVYKSQVENIAELFPLRDRLQYLVSDLPEIQSGSERDVPHAYEWQIAESLRLGLVGQKDAAKRTMEAAIENVVAQRVSDGRTSYLVWAGTLVLGAIALLGAVAVGMGYFLGYTPEQLRPGLGYLMLATGSGAMGAMLSTAIALRDRTVGTDGWKSNGVDSGTRIMIGVISAALLYTLLESNLLSNFYVSIDQLSKGQTTQIWNVALVVGFLAGFVERLVPNLLEKKVAPAIVK
jgi:hypothetical protein